jgi:hypothetical protein
LKKLLLALGALCYCTSAHAHGVEMLFIGLSPMVLQVVGLVHIINKLRGTSLSTWKIVVFYVLVAGACWVLIGLDPLSHFFSEAALLVQPLVVIVIIVLILGLTPALLLRLVISLLRDPVRGDKR